MTHVELTLAALLVAAVLAIPAGLARRKPPKRVLRAPVVHLTLSPRAVVALTAKEVESNSDAR